MYILEGQREKIVSEIITEGNIYAALANSMQRYERGDHFSPWHVSTSYPLESKWSSYFSLDYALQKLLLDELHARGEIIFYNRKDVGALIRFKGGNFPSAILTDYLISATNKMNLDNAQINEVERLLNKVNRSLNIALPDVHKPNDAQMQEVLRNLMLEVIQSKPKHFYQRYLDALSAQGTPVEMTSKEFHSFAEKTFKS